MDLRKYEVLLRVVDLGNMTQAALELNYTQSGISHMVRSMEDDFGFPLLVRGKAGVSPTREGREVLPRIRALVEASDALRQSVASITGIQVGSVRIGAFQSVASFWILPVVREFRADYPKIDIHLIDGTSGEMERMLLEHRIDLGIFCPPPRTKLRSETLKRDPYIAVVPPNHPLAGERLFPVEEFSNNNFILGSMSTTIQALRDAGGFRSLHAFRRRQLDGDRHGRGRHGPEPGARARISHETRDDRRGLAPRQAYFPRACAPVA